MSATGAVDTGITPHHVVGVAAEPASRAVRVFVVDRHQVVADCLQLVLEQDAGLDVIGTAVSVAGAVLLALAKQPDVVLADYLLPDGTGAELVARLRREQPHTRVLFLSSVVSDVLMKEAFTAGARGFLDRNMPGEGLSAAVRRVAAGEMLISPARLARLLTASGRERKLLDPLTTRERDVLRWLSAGLDNHRIAARMGIGYVTVRSHVRNLSSKLGAHSRLEILARSAELGLVAVATHRPGPPLQGAIE